MQLVGLLAPSRSLYSVQGVYSNPELERLVSANLFHPYLSGLIELFKKVFGVEPSALGVHSRNVVI
jgi:hypothetical protein